MPGGNQEDAKSNATLELVINKFSKIGEKKFWSRPCTIGNLAWRMSARLTVENVSDSSAKKNLAVFVHCDSELLNFWMCFATVKIYIASQKEGIRNFQGDYFPFHAVYYFQARSRGYNELAAFDDVINPENGLIKDDRIILRADVNIDIDTSQNITWKSIKPSGMIETYHTTEKDSNTYNPAPEASFVFILNKYNRLELENEIFSLPCKIGPFLWKIRITRQNSDHSNDSDNSDDSDDSDNSFSPSGDNLGFFLTCEEESGNSSWSCFANVQLRILSHNSILRMFSNTFKRNIQHLFCSNDNQIGFDVSWKYLNQTECQLIDEDRIIFRANVFIDTPHGLNWNSKQETGYVGLINQRSTCCMNSLLQTFYFINQLRKAVYEIPTGKVENKSFALVLQRLFRDLQCGDEPVDTTMLTKSLRYEKLDLFTPYDVPELIRILLDKLESEIKDTSMEGIVRNLFEGKMEHFVKCKNKSDVVRTSEIFSSLQLNNDCWQSNINDLFEVNFTARDEYNAGDHGIQDAINRVIFESLPPVLLVCLKRFDYDHSTGHCKKSDYQCVPSEKINLDSYLKNVESTPSNYTLFAVLAHSGDPFDGHYVVFINPECEEKWYEFDDEVVSNCPKKAAIENNVEGDSEDCRFAHLLVYVRDSMFEHVFEEVADDDVPSDLEFESKPKAKRAKRKETKEVYTTIRVFVEDCFDGHQGHDLFDLAQVPDFSDKEETLVTLFQVKNTTTVEQISIMLSKSFGRPLDQMRIWPFTKRSNKSYRPMYFDVDAKRRKKVGDFVTNNLWDLFLEMFPIDLGDYPLPVFDDESKVILFFKLYEPKIHKLYYCEHSYFEFNSTLEKLILKLNEKAGYPPDTKLIVYKEVGARTLKKIVASSGPLKKVLEELANGDIIVFQKDDLAKDLPNVEKHYIHL